MDQALQSRVPGRKEAQDPAPMFDLIELFFFAYRDFTNNLNKTGDALTAAAAVAELPLQAIQLNAFAQGHLTQVFAGVTLHIPTLTHKSDHGHGQVAQGWPPLWNGANNCVL